MWLIFFFQFTQTKMQTLDSGWYPKNVLKPALLSHCNLKVTGRVYFTATVFPRCFPGIQRGML